MKKNLQEKKKKKTLWLFTISSWKWKINYYFGSKQIERWKSAGANFPCEISAIMTSTSGKNAVDRMMPVVLVKFLPPWPSPQGKMLWIGFFFLPFSDKPELDLIFFFLKPNQKRSHHLDLVWILIWKHGSQQCWKCPGLFFSWVILYVTHHMCLATYLNTASSFSFNTPRKSYFLQHHTQTVSVSIPFTAWIMYFLENRCTWAQNLVPESCFNISQPNLVSGASPLKPTELWWG